MSDVQSSPTRKNVLVRFIEAVGAIVLAKAMYIRETVTFIGEMSELVFRTTVWIIRSIVEPGVRFRRTALFEQMVRVGVKSVGIVVLVELFIGMIIALQLAPTLEDYGQLERVADVVAIATVRELGPLIAAIVLSGFAGASIAAELGAMKESEEIKALRAHALNPIQFLVVPRFLATVIMLTGLCVIADVVGIVGGFLVAITTLDVPAGIYYDLTREAIGFTDYFTGLFKAAVFGMLIALIACTEGLKVSGGAEGVGKATTATVVKSIVAIIFVDALFTALFYAWGL